MGETLTEWKHLLQRWECADAPPSLDELDVKPAVPQVH